MGACASAQNGENFAGVSTGLDVKSVNAADGAHAKGAKGGRVGNTGTGTTTTPSSDSEPEDHELPESDLDLKVAAQHRDAGNTAYLASDLDTAFAEYCRALSHLPRKEATSGTEAGEQRCIILSNKAQVQLRRREWASAARAAEEALGIDSAHEPSEQRLRLAHVHIAAEYLIHPDAMSPPDCDDDDEEFGPPEVVESSDDESDYGRQ